MAGGGGAGSMNAGVGSDTSAGEFGVGAVGAVPSNSVTSNQSMLTSVRELKKSGENVPTLARDRLVVNPANQEPGGSGVSSPKEC